MKRLIITIIGVSLAAIFASCGAKDESPEATAETPAESAPVEQIDEPAPDPVNSGKTLQERAESGDADAAFELASKFEEAGDLESAFLWYKRGARDSHVGATYKVATFYHHGIATERDLAKARRCYVIASKSEHEGAKKALVDMVLNQEKVAQFERTVMEEEFEGMTAAKALPLMKEKAMREVEEWQKSDEYAKLVADARERLYDEYGINRKFLKETNYQPLSLLKRQVESKLEDADIEGQLNERFSDEVKAEAEALAAREYPSADVGDSVTIRSRRGEVTGTIQSISDTEIRVSGTTVLMDDVPANERRKLDPEYIRKSRARVMAQEFHGPRAEYDQKLRTATESEVMLDAGYVFHNGKWGTTSQMVQYVVTPAIRQYEANAVRQKAQELYRGILERNGFTLVGDRVMTIAERDKLIKQHTEAIAGTVMQIAELLRDASSPEDFTKAINLSNQALGRYVLATNRSDLMQARAALVQGKTKLTGIIEHNQHRSRIGKPPIPLAPKSKIIVLARVVAAQTVAAAPRSTPATASISESA